MQLSNFSLVLIFICCIATASWSSFCNGGVIPASFVFGDSLVDCGNNNYITTLSKANYAPNGIDFPPNRAPTGRFTNGRTIPDIIGQELGLKQFTPAYLAPTTGGANILYGVNYASGGGGILNETGYIFVGRINMDAQIDNYENTRQDMMARLGAAPATNLLRKSFFSVVIGSNDFINNYLTPVLSESERKWISPDTFVDIMIASFKLQLTRLYNLDARKLIVANVGPIGCIPYQRDINPAAGDDCVEFPNQLARSFNERLKSLVAELSLTFKEAIFVYADVYHIVADIIQNFTSYGFENADSACCHATGRHGGLVPCGPKSKVCLDRSKYVFWDAYHPSDAVNTIIAKRLVDGDSQDVYPMNLRRLARA